MLSWMSLLTTRARVRVCLTWKKAGELASADWLRRIGFGGLADGGLVDGEEVGGFDLWDEGGDDVDELGLGVFDGLVAHLDADGEEHSDDCDEEQQLGDDKQFDGEGEAVKGECGL